jgi:AraC-like DNA-binding protein
MIIFHIVAEGRCWLEADGEPRRWLDEGDMVAFPLGHSHRMGAGDVDAPVPIATLFPPQPWVELPILRHGGNGDITRIVCVYLRCDELPFNPVLSSLPNVLIVRRQDEATQWTDATVRYIVHETTNGGAGGAGLIARLTELLFIEILRRHIGETRDEDTGWLAALHDRHLAQALLAFHTRPDHNWTVAALARHVGLSRSALVGRFHRLLALTPMSYLTLWRLQLAAQALRNSDAGIAAVAAEVGYGSEAAFSRAFKRHTGVPPSAWRRGKAASGGIAQRAE